jgi:DNA polymerase I
MKIPLSVKAFINKNDEQKLEIWSNGNKQIVDPPFKPYFLSKRSLAFSNDDRISEEPFNVKLLSTLQETKIFKYVVPNTNFIKDINKSLYKSNTTDAVFENKVPLLTRIMVDTPEFFNQYPNTDDLTFFYFDIETLFEDHVDKKLITSIAYASNNRKIYSHQGDEKRILEWFLSEVEKINPDVMVGYYMRDFDLVRIIERCKFHGIDYRRLARDREVYYYKDERTRSINMKIGGRVLYDILDSVNQDQTIFGVKNHKLKTMTEWFKIEKPEWTIIKKFDSTIPIEILKKYNEDDIRRTYGMFDIYWNNIMTLVEMFKVPLNIVTDNKQTIFAQIFMGRGLYKQGIVSDGMNKDRHPEIFNRQKEKGEKGNYEAAMVGIYLPGFHKKVWKVDFSGFYPSIMAAFNLSPDSCKIVGYDKYDGEFKTQIIGDKIVYTVPDKVINKNIHIAVKSGDGFLRKELRAIREERNIIKQKSKQCTGKEKDILESRQWYLKVMQNIPSGVNGQAVFSWGDIGVTILCVGIARELLKDLKTYLDCPILIVIEADTDGLYLSEKPDMDNIGAFLSNLIKSKFGLEESSEIYLDLDEYKSGYFIKQKNYILMNLNDSITYHGVSLKSSRMPPLFDKSKEILSIALLDGETNIKKILNQVLKMDQYDITDFTLRTTIHKKLNTYSKGSLQKGSLQVKLGKQAELLGIEVIPETQFEYMKVLEGYRIAQHIKSIKEIDMKYYTKIIEKLIINFGYEQELKTKNIQTLDNWM